MRLVHPENKPSAAGSVGDTASLPERHATFLGRPECDYRACDTLNPLSRNGLLPVNKALSPIAIESGGRESLRGGAYGPGGQGALPVPRYSLDDDRLPSLLRAAGFRTQAHQFRAAIAPLTTPLAEFDGNLRPH